MNGLLFITHQTAKYNCLQSVEIALKGGCRQIQLRMKDACITDVEKTAFQAKALCDEYGADLYLNDHVEVCQCVKAKGVHLGKTDMSPSEARSILGDDYVIGGTANTFDDILYLKKQGVDYIGLGPFRITATKKNLSPVLGSEGFRDIMNLCRQYEIKLPVFAIGGITINDIPDLMLAGAMGIALSSTVLNAENPVYETGRIINFLKNF